MAAMLDMAFQLLAFFILTYNPAPVEGCIAIRMPLPTPVTKPEVSTGGGAPTPGEADALASALALRIAVTANKEGAISAIRVGQQPPVTDLRDFEQKLRSFTKVPGIRFEQVLLEVSPVLKYQNALSIIEICARNKLLFGDSQTKVSIVEMP